MNWSSFRWNGKTVEPQEMTFTLRHGPVGMFFLPAAFAPTSQNIMALASRRASEFKIPTYGVVTDSPEAVAAWVKQEQFTIPVIADFVSRGSVWEATSIEPLRLDVNKRYRRISVVARFKDGTWGNDWSCQSGHVEDHVVLMLDWIRKNGDLE